MIRAIRSTSQQDAEGTFITGALNYCFSELFDVTVDGPICPKSVIILMGNGIENIGSDPAERSGLFVQEGGDVVAVGFGPEVDEKALMNINGDDDFFNANTRSIRNLAREILTKLGIEPISEDMVMSS